MPDEARDTRGCCVRRAAGAAAQATGGFGAIPEPAEVARCSNGDAAACTVAGDYYHERGDDARAVPLYQQACTRHDMLGCDHLGDAYSSGQGADNDAARGFQLYDQACRGGLAEGCSDVARGYEQGRGVARDLARAVRVGTRAIRMHQRACQRGSMRSCLLLGRAYGEGSPGVAADATHAAQLFQQACDGGDGEGCEALAVAYGEGHGVAQNATLSVSLLQRACDAGRSSACAAVGGSYFRGSGVTQDLGHAFQFYQRACSGGDAWGCFAVAEFTWYGRGMAADHDRALELMRQLCGTGRRSESCAFVQRNQSATPTAPSSVAGAGGAPPARTPTPSSAAPVAWWRGDGDARDSRGGHDGQIVGNVTFARGVSGSAFVFDGNGAHVEVPDSSALNPRQQLTIDLRVLVVGNLGGHGDIVSKDGEDSERQYLVTVSDTNRFRAHVGVNGTFRYFDGNTVVQRQRWYRVTMAYDGQTLRLYVDGRLDGQIDAPGALDVTSQPVRIGGGAPAGHAQLFLQGMVDEVRIFDRAFTPDQI